MTDRVTLGVQFDPDSELLEDFEEYKEENGFTSRAETMRHLMREQLHGDPLDDRPETLLAGLLWDARRDIHTFFAVSLLAAVLSVLTGGLLEIGFAVLSLSYLLTVTVGFIDAVVLSNSIKFWSMGAAAPGKNSDEVDA